MRGLAQRDDGAEKRGSTRRYGSGATAQRPGLGSAEKTGMAHPLDQRRKIDEIVHRRGAAAPIDRIDEVERGVTADELDRGDRPVRTTVAAAIARDIAIDQRLAHLTS